MDYMNSMHQGSEKGKGFGTLSVHNQKSAFSIFSKFPSTSVLMTK